MERSTFLRPEVPVPDDTVNAIAEEYWEALLDAVPVLGILIGDRRRDDRIEDLSVEGETAQRATWSDLRSRAEALDETELSLVDRATRGLLIGELSEHMESIDARMAEFRYDQMDGVHSSLLTVAPQINAPAPENATALVERHRKTAGMIDQAIDRFRAGLAVGRTPPALVVARSLDQLDRYLGSPLDEDPLVTMEGPEGWDGTDAWRAELVDIVESDIRPALGRYRRVLAEELVPAARPDDKPGLCWLDDGAELYATLVRQHTSLDLDPEAVHAIGMEEATERLPREYAEVGGRLFGTSDVSEVFHRLRTDPELRYANGEEIMDDARRCLTAAKAAMGGWFGRLPVADCEIQPVPEFLAPSSPAAYYFPPAADGSRPGGYFVNVHQPETKNRFETASIAYHEAIPGHHLQLAISTELDDLPAFRKFSWSHTAYVEGWALYTERLADEMGLYATDLDRIGMLAGDAWRACRLVVDTGLHAMGWSRQQAIDFMVANAPVGLDEIAIEVDRYVAIPGQALSYKVGQREIIRLRAEAEARLGDRFDIRGFHDAVLSGAAVSLPVLAGIVEDWVVRTSGG